MKKFLIILIITISFIVFINCGGAYSSLDCYMTVKKKYEKVIIIPGKDFTFLAIDKNNDIHYVRNYNFTDAEISSDIILIKKEEICSK